MNTRKRAKLNKVENILYFIIVAAIIIDVVLDKSSVFLLILSTTILVIAIVGIIAIEWVKLQWRQRQ